MRSLDEAVGFLIFLAVAGYLLVVLYRHFSRPTWKDMPTLQAYLQKFPSCKTNQGIRCRRCQSNSIRNWGWKSADDAPSRTNA